MNKPLFILIFACVASLCHAVPHPFQPNLALSRPVSASCEAESCWYQDQVPSLVSDGDNDTFWSSPPLSEITQPQIIIDLLQEFIIFEVAVTFPSLLPTQWTIELSNSPFRQVRYFSADCSGFENCTQIDSTDGPLKVRAPLNTSLGTRARYVRIFLNSLQSEQNRSNLFYTISEVEVLGGCSCNGYANECYQDPDASSMYKCRCQASTCGNHCESCCEGFQLLEYVSRREDPAFKCKVCDNCTISLIRELDLLSPDFNTTADLFDSLILTIPSLQPELDALNSSLSSLLTDTSESLAVTSSLELAVYGRNSNYTQLVDVQSPECASQINVSVLVFLSQLVRHNSRANSTVSRLFAVANNLTTMISNHQQSILDISLTLSTANATLQNYYEELDNSLSYLQELGNEADSLLSQAKLNLSTIIFNDKYIYGTLQEATLLSANVDTFYLTITQLMTLLTQYESQAMNIYAELRAQSRYLFRYELIANTSLDLYRQIVRDRVKIEELFYNATELYSRISPLENEINSLIDEIESLLERIRDIIGSIETCVEVLGGRTSELSNRNVELSQSNSGIDTELETFLSTSSILPAVNYTLAAETYALQLIQIANEIVSIAKTAPNTTITLPLTELELRYAIGNASTVVDLRETLTELIRTIRGDGIYSRIRELYTLNGRLNNTADLLISEATAVLNRAWPYVNMAESVKAKLSRLNARVDALLLLAGLEYEDGEYTETLSRVRGALESNRTELSAQEPQVNSTTSRVVSAQTLIPNITLYNNASTQLRDSMLAQLSDAEQRTSSIVSALDSLRNKTSTIKSRNSRLLSRLEKVYSRLNRVHNELQLPKAPLRLDGSMVVSLQPPPTEQRENASYSSDYSFYFEPVSRNVIDSEATSFLFFYAGPAIHENSTDTSVLRTDDFLAIVSDREVMGYRARIGGTEFSGSLQRNELIRSNGKYRVRIKRVGSAFRFYLKSATREFSTTPTISSESLHNFLFKSTPNTAYYVGGHPDDVMIAESLQAMNKFRGCVYLALTLRSNLYSLWDTRYHTNLLTDQTGLDCVRHSETQTDFDVDALSFNGYGHAYVPYSSNTPIISLTATPQRPDGLILTAWGTNGNQERFIFSLYLRDSRFNFDVSVNGGERQTFSASTPVLMSTQYSIEMRVASSAYITFKYGQDLSFTLTTDTLPHLYSADVLLFGGISQIAVVESNNVLANWTTSYYRNYTGCIADIILLRTGIEQSLVSKDFDFNSKGSTGVSLGCSIIPIPEYSVTKTSITGYIDFRVLTHEGGIPSTFNHAEKNYELLPTAIGDFGTNPVDFTVPYSLSLIVSKPEFIGSKAVLIHISDSVQGLEVSIDTSLNVTLEVSRNGGTDSVSSPLDLSRNTRMHVITVHTIGSDNGLNLFVDDNPSVSLSGVFDLMLPRVLTSQQELFVGGNGDPDTSFVGCLKEVALYDSLLNLGIGDFVPTGTSPPDSQGIEHDMCGFHPYTGLVYGGTRALVHPFNYTEAISRRVD